MPGEDEAEQDDDQNDGGRGDGHFQKQVLKNELLKHWNIVLEIVNILF